MTVTLRFAFTGLALLILAAASPAAADPRWEGVWVTYDVVCADAATSCAEERMLRPGMPLLALAVWGGRLSIPFECQNPDLSDVRVRDVRLLEELLPSISPMGFSANFVFAGQLRCDSEAVGWVVVDRGAGRIVTNEGANFMMRRAFAPATSAED